MVAMPIILFPLNATVEDAQFRLAVELYEEGMYADSLVEFDRLIDEMRTKKYVEAGYFYRGNIYMALGRFEAAREQLQGLIDSFPESPFLHQSLYLLGRSEYLLENYGPAVTLFDTYVSRYPSLDYADNSLYWKAESFLALGNREEARQAFEEVLERYPNGNKADAARFKLELMDIEDEIAAQETAPTETEGEREPASGEWQVLEREYQSNIQRLNERIQQLRIEIDELQGMGEVADEEGAAQLEERMKALIAWENILKIKEESLNQKELQLDQELERIQRLSEGFERFDDE
jgi:TolA-binding protein